MVLVGFNRRMVMRSTGDGEPVRIDRRADPQTRQFCHRVVDAVGLFSLPDESDARGSARSTCLCGKGSKGGRRIAHIREINVNGIEHTTSPHLDLVGVDIHRHPHGLENTTSELRVSL